MQHRPWARTAAFVFTTLITTYASAAEVTAYGIAANSVGNQAWTGPLGLDFDVVRPISVYSLGTFDHNSDGLMAPITVQIYNRDNAKIIAQLTFGVGEGVLVGGNRILPLPCPLTLPAGFHGAIVGYGYNGLENNGNGNAGRSTDDGGGAITFLGGGRYGAQGTTAYPTILDGGPNNRYAAGTFLFNEACAQDADCTNPDRPKCGDQGICGKAAGDFFPACNGGTNSCDLSTATCTACATDYGGGGLTCFGPSSKACVAGSCKECNAGIACAVATTPVCKANVCAACASDNGEANDPCPTTGNPYCKGDGSCGKCTAAADCANRGGGRTFCDVASGSCVANCATDSDCGSTTSGKVCDNATKKCLNGCRGTGGNGCVPGQLCSSTTAAQGTCSTPPGLDAGTDSGPKPDGGSSSSGGTDAGKDSGSVSDSGIIQDSGTTSSSSGGGADGGGSSSGDTGGCGCVTAGSGGSGSAAALLGLGAAVVAMIRRKRD